MFQYSTETIINSNVGNIPVGGKNVRYAAVAMSENGLTAGTDAFLVDGVGLYYADKIAKVTLREYQEAKPDTIEITIPKSLEGVYRLAIYTSQEGISSSIYADAQLRHKKPFFYEVENPTAAKLAKLIEKEMKMTDFNFFKAEGPEVLEGNDSTLTLTADDCYTRFQKVHLAKIEMQEGNTTGWAEYAEVKVDWERFREENTGATLTVKGTEGNGTVARLIKNIKLPTDANTNPFASDNGGRPVPGGKYDQVVLEYVTERRHIGGQVMGALDKSITTHVFWVEQTGAFDFVSTLQSLVADEKEETVTPIASNAKATVKPKVGSKQ